MKHQSITALPASPETERRVRMIKYTVAMSIRVVCIVAMLFVEGWWLAVFAAGAIFLPYFAVVVANVKHRESQTTVVRPGSVMPLPHSGPAAQPPTDEGQKA